MIYLCVSLLLKFIFVSVNTRMSAGKVLREIHLADPVPVTRTTFEVQSDMEVVEPETPAEIPHWIRVLTILLDGPGTWTETIEQTSVSLMRFFMFMFVCFCLCWLLSIIGKRFLFRYIHQNQQKKQKKSE